MIDLRGVLLTAAFLNWLLHRRFGPLPTHFGPQYRKLVSATQSLQRAWSIDIATCLDCARKLRIIACIVDPPLIRHILGHIERREALLDRVARAPPDNRLQTVSLT